MSENMQAQLTAFAKDLHSLEPLTVTSEATPEPGKGEVLVKILLAPVNPTDLHQLQGLRPIGYKKFPQVPGTEGVGKIVKLGSGVSRYSVSQRVVGVFFPGAFSGSGTWQQYVIGTEDTLVAVPDRLSDKSASQYVVNPLTAFGLVKVAEVPKGGWVLHTGASSVLGRMFIILAKQQGLKSINVVRRSVHKKELLGLGADVVIGTDEEDLVKRVLEVTGGEGAYTSIDSVGDKQFDQVVAATRNGGTIISYGCLSGEPCQITAREMFYNLKKVQGFLLGVWLMSLGEKKQQVLDEVMTLLADKVIEPLSGDVYPLKDVAKAVVASEQPGRGGKLFLQP